MAIETHDPNFEHRVSLRILGNARRFLPLGLAGGGRGRWVRGLLDALHWNGCIATAPVGHAFELYALGGGFWV